MPKTNQNDIENQIAKDLELCDLGIALTKGKIKKKYLAHKKACFAALHELNEKEGLNNMTDEELLDELL